MERSRFEEKKKQPDSGVISLWTHRAHQAESLAQLAECRQGGLFYLPDILGPLKYPPVIGRATLYPLGPAPIR